MVDFDNFFKNQNDSNLKRILVVDFSHLAWRMIFASAINAKKESFSKEEIYAFWRHLVMNGIFSLIEKDDYDRVIIAYDGKHYWRKNLFPEYKAHRKDARDKNKLIDFDEFFVVLNEFIEEFKKSFTNLVHLQVDSAEADDVIAVFVKSNHEKNKITVVTGDSDFKQLLRYSNVTLYDPMKKKNAVTSDYRKELQLKIISGDKSDNIPAVTGKKSMVVNKACKVYNMGVEKFAEEIDDEEVMKRFELNTKLINFDFIPIEESQKIIENYDVYETKKHSLGRVINFTSKYNLRLIGEKLMGKMGKTLNSIM
jgi:hypothetical protein